MTLHYVKLMCPDCGREILIRFALTGTFHDADMRATCAACIRRRHPEPAANIEAWLTEPDPIVANQEPDL
jgi:hypothetical protein